MNIIEYVFSYLSGLGSIVMVPIVITIVGLITRLNIKDSFKSGITVGIGLIAINITLSLVWDQIGPLAKIFVDKFGLTLNTIDVGWGVAAGLAFSTSIGSFIIPFIILLNIFMLALKFTRTINIDIWNYWFYAFTGSVANYVSNSLLIGFITAGIHCIISLIIADKTAKIVQKSLDMPGISVPQGYAVTTVPIFLLLDRLYNFIDKLFIAKKKHENSSYKFRVIFRYFEWLKDPVILGLIIGILLSVSVQYSVKQTLTVGISMAALMFLMPRAVKIIMEGLLPISEQAKEFMQKKYSGKEFYIGLDSAILLGLPTTIAVGLVLIPATIILAAVIPWNTTIPLGDLAATAFFVSMATPIHRGSFWKTLVSGILMMGIALSVASFFAPILTSFKDQTIPENATYITGLSAGNWFSFILYQAAKLRWLGIAIAAALCGAIVFLARRKSN